MNITETREKLLKSIRARELDELRSKGVAKTRKNKLKDFASPLTTPEQAKMFLRTMRDKSKKEPWETKPPTHLTADGIDAWYMMQKRREREMRERKKEAAELLRGYRGPYFSDDASWAMSPRNRGRGRASFGDALSDTLSDPSATDKRRQSSYPRLQTNWRDDGMTPDQKNRPRNRIGPERTKFLNEKQHYDGTQYGKPEDRTAYENGRKMVDSLESSQEAKNQGRVSFDNDLSFFSPVSHYTKPVEQTPHPKDQSWLRDGPRRQLDDSEQREPVSLDPRRERDSIDTSASQERLREAVEKKTRFSTDSRDSKGRDDRSVPETVWRDFISSEPGAKFPPEAGRYHLYASYACPGSHRALIVRALKGLEDVISVTIVHPTWRHTNLDDSRDKHRGWVFGDPNGEPFQNTTGRGGPFPPAYPGNEPDPILGAYSVRQLYEYAEDTSGKYTIPLLWDKKLNTIVNNESSDISYMLNSCFNELSSAPELDLYTEDDEDGLDRLNEVSQWLYPMMIHGVYRCGFAKTQQAYDHAIEELTAAFDMADEILQNQRYLTGDTLTDADIRLFVTLLRFDEVYAFYFRANSRLVMLTPALLNFCREIYQMHGVAETCKMDQIKAHFFGSHAEWNKYSVIPRGLGFMDLLTHPHDRDQFVRNDQMERTHDQLEMDRTHDQLEMDKTHDQLERTHVQVEQNE